MRRPCLWATPLLLAACSGPLPSQRLGLAPLTDPGPYRVRLAPHKLDPTLPDPDAAPPAAPPPAHTPSRPPGRRGGGIVSLTAQDLAPVHAWLGTPDHGQWILGDVVDVVVSKEFFASTLTVNTISGWLKEVAVRREDRIVGDDELITLTYMGQPGTEHAITAPRVQLGPGLMVSARRVLRLRMVKTEDPSRPVRARIVAQGRSRRGQGDQVVQRGDVLQIRGDLVWDARARRWVWSAS
ncbi:MAG: hypothetical protein AB7T63_06360 [Planctomycetota bacterium]